MFKNTFLKPIFHILCNNYPYCPNKYFYIVGIDLTSERAIGLLHCLVLFKSTAPLVSRPIEAAYNGGNRFPQRKSACFY